MISEYAKFAALIEGLAPYGPRKFRAPDHRIGPYKQRPTGHDLPVETAAVWLDLCGVLTRAGWANEDDPEDRRGFTHACRLTGLGWSDAVLAIGQTNNFGVGPIAPLWREMMKPADPRCLGEVYTARIAGKDGLLKIGFSTDLRKRMRSLQRMYGAECSIHSRRPGTILHEWALHQIIRPRVGTELYRDPDVPTWLVSPQEKGE